MLTEFFPNWCHKMLTCKMRSASHRESLVLCGIVDLFQSCNRCVHLGAFWSRNTKHFRALTTPKKILAPVINEKVNVQHFVFQSVLCVWSRFITWMILMYKKCLCSLKGESFLVERNTECLNHRIRMFVLIWATLLYSVTGINADEGIQLYNNLAVLIIRYE